MTSDNLKREAMEVAEEILTDPESIVEIIREASGNTEVRIKGKRGKAEPRKAEFKQT